ncbi:MAG: MoaE-MoaD fusion protein [Actinomycetota bacterium]|nr:MoaE-MoaD fusion protein [Actinomycetota bacterium]
MAKITTELTERPLDPSRAIEDAASDECGAIASFVGTVRSSASVPDRAKDRVLRLEYEAHPTLASEKLTAIAEEAAGKWDLAAVVALHRVGVCDLGEPTVVVVCAAPHRREALEACHWTIDEIKRSVPIWKREVYADGTSWVGAEGSNGS